MGHAVDNMKLQGKGPMSATFQHRVPKSGLEMIGRYVRKTYDPRVAELLYSFLSILTWQEVGKDHSGSESNARFQGLGQEVL